MCGSTSVPSVPTHTEPVPGMRSPTRQGGRWEAARCRRTTTSRSSSLPLMGVPGNTQCTFALSSSCHAWAAVQRRSPTREPSSQRAIGRAEDVAPHVAERAGAEADALAPLARMVDAALERPLVADAEPPVPVERRWHRIGACRNRPSSPHSLFAERVDFLHLADRAAPDDRLRESVATASTTPGCPSAYARHGRSRTRSACGPRASSRTAASGSRRACPGASPPWRWRRACGPASRR